MSERPSEPESAEELASKMNNFRFSLPGQHYRTLYTSDRLGDDSDINADLNLKLRLFSKIDELASIFPDLNLEHIGKNLLAHRSNKEHEKFNEEYAKLPPLFERLLEEGFTEIDLAGQNY
jgi:hypothetical protein